MVAIITGCPTPLLSFIILILAINVNLSLAWQTPPQKQQQSASASIVSTSSLPSSTSTSPVKTKFDRIKYEQENKNVISKRWNEFVSESAPFASKAARLWASGRLRRDDKALATACRETLTNLGPTFIKLGQILSVREDVLGPVWATELAKLQDGVRPFPGEEALAIVRHAFGDDDAALLLESMALEPVAAASLAQVHRGKWQNADDGTILDVAFKVLRPGIQDRVAADLCVLLQAGDLLADWAPRVLPLSRVDWQALLEGLAGALWDECDLVGEAERQTKFERNMRSVPRVFVPTVIAVTKNVMVSEWVNGLPLNSIPTMDPRLVQAQKLMRDAYCQSLFVDAFFHADCHGGNLLWVPRHNSSTTLHTRHSIDAATTVNDNTDDRLCILDCGLMVAIDTASAEGLLRLTLHLAARDWTRVVDTAIDLQFLPSNLTQSEAITARRVARRIVGPYLDVGGGAKASSAYSLSSLFQDISAAALDLPTALPPDMVLLGRAIIQLEGIALRSDPDYRLVDDILPLATRIALRTPTSSGSVEHGDNGGGIDDAVAGLRKSLLFDLLYDDITDDDDASKPTNTENVASSSSSFVLEKLRLLLDTASSASSTDDEQKSTTTRTIENLIDELLQATAIRDVVAKETSNIIDAMARDALWKGTDSLFEAISMPSIIPKPSTRILESLAPRLQREEQLVLLRLPQILQQLLTNYDDENSNSIGPNLPPRTSIGNSNNSRQSSGILQDITAVKVASIPGFSKGLRAILEQTLLSKDPNARATVDAIKIELQNKLQARLEESGLPSDLAKRLVDTTFPTPW